ncbi:MAG: ribosomal protein L7/L12 [Thainema sp.]
MKLVKRIAAGVLLAWGFICAVRVVDVSLARQIDPPDRRNIIVACLMLGTPALAGGGWLVWQEQQRREQQIDKRLQAVFFQLLRQGEGYISVLPFAMQTELNAAEAKAYLDQRARDFQADFQVSETGQVFYYFDINGISSKQLGGAVALERFDVVLESFPSHERRLVIRAIKQIRDCSWKEAKALVDYVPFPVQQNIDRPLAEAAQRKLAATGANVILILKNA